MIAAGLFFQLSNLQAMTPEMQQAINLFGGNDAVKATASLPDAKKMNPGEARKKAATLGTPEAEAVAYYVSSNVGGTSSQKKMFQNKDKANIDVEEALGLKQAAPQAAPAQQQTRQNANADFDAANERADKAEQAAAQTQAKYDDLKKQSELANQTMQQSVKAAKDQTKDAQDKLAALEAKFTNLQSEATKSDSDIKKLVDTAKDKHGADKYIPLAQKAAESLKAAIESINDTTEQEAVRKAVQDVLAPQAPAAASAQSGVNLGRLGKKAARKA